MEPKNQENVKMPRSKKIAILTVGFVFVILVLSVSLIFLLSERAATTPEKVSDSVSRKTDTSAEPVTSTSEVLESSDSGSTVESQTVYFGEGWDGRNFAVNTKTGEKKDILPLGYEIVSQFEYQNFPTFLILQKDDSVYYFDVKNNKIQNIINSDNNLKLKKDERLTVAPSITEKNKFFIRVDKIDLSAVNEMGGLNPISSEQYLFDAETGKFSLTKIDNLDSCFEYDSKNFRFFTWLCGEGVGSSAPLSVVGIDRDLRKDIVTAADFGISASDFVKVQYNNGFFFVFNYGAGNGVKVIIVDAKSSGFLKEEYSISKDLEKEIGSVYSMALDKERKLLIIGRNDSIGLLRFDSDNKIFEAQNIPGYHVYANFIYLNENKLYYLADANINIINLDTLKIDKLIPVSGNYQEITLFNF